MLHKDFVGAPIKINDKVVAMSQNKYRNLVTAQVIRFTKRQVCIRIDGEERDTIRMPKNLVVVTRKK